MTHAKTLHIAILLYESSSDAPGYEPLYREDFLLPASRRWRRSA